MTENIIVELELERIDARQTLLVDLQIAISREDFDLAEWIDKKLAWLDAQQKSLESIGE